MTADTKTAQPEASTPPPGGRTLSRTEMWWLVASTPLVLLVTHVVAVLPHEFMHSFVAWILGIKANPWLIDWGGTSLGNVLLLLHIDENVDYEAALANGQNVAVAVVALSGPLLANGGLYLLFRWLSGRDSVRGLPVLSYIVFWLVVMNLANIWCYIPMRAFAPDGDIRHFIWATDASPWLLYAIVGYFVTWGLIDFYRRMVPRVVESADITSPAARAIVLVVATTVIFGYFAIPGFLETDEVSQVIAGTSALMIPPIVLLQWRRVVGRPSEESGAERDTA